MESHTRSILKALSWRFFGAVVTTCVIWAVTGKPIFAAGVGMAETVLKLGAFYFHERVWNRLNIGRPKPPEYQI